jgi:hypothetical protein
LIFLCIIAARKNIANDTSIGTSPVGWTQKINPTETKYISVNLSILLNLILSKNHDDNVNNNIMAGVANEYPLKTIKLGTAEIKIIESKIFEFLILGNRFFTIRKR